MINQKKDNSGYFSSELSYANNIHKHSFDCSQNNEVMKSGFIARCSRYIEINLIF